MERKTPAAGAIVPFGSPGQTGARPSADHPADPQQGPSQYDTLQSLLAFWAMHEQVRRRKTLKSRRSEKDVAGVKADLEEEARFTLDETLQLIADRAVAITGADGMAIALPENNQIALRTAAGAVRPDLGACIDRDSAFSGACLRRTQILSCDDTETDARVNLEACRRLGVRSMVAVPLCDRKHGIGLLQAFSAHPSGFDGSDVRNLSILADLVLAAITPEEEPRFAETAPVEAPKLEALPRELDGMPVARPQIAEQRESVASRFGMPVLVLCIVIASALWGRVFWRLQSPQFANKAQRTENMARRSSGNGAKDTPAAPFVPATANSSIHASATSNESHASNSSAKRQELSQFPMVAGIQHWSSADSTTVVLDLGGQVQYEAHRLANPHRIYFDLRDTQLSPSLAFKTIPVGDALLKRIRVAQTVTGMTRIVLETKTYSDFSVKRESNPYRLVIEVRQGGAGPKGAVNRLPIAIEAEKGKLPNGVPFAKQLEAQNDDLSLATLFVTPARSDIQVACWATSKGLAHYCDAKLLETAPLSCGIIHRAPKMLFTPV